MKTLLPFDDFVLNRNENTRRIFKQPNWLFDQAFSDESITLMGGPGGVVLAPQGGYYRYYYGYFKDETVFDDEHLRVFIAWSPDGIHFEPYPVHPDAPFPSYMGRFSSVIGFFPFYDEAEADPRYRYKSPNARFGIADDGKMYEEPYYMLGSPDMIHWERINDSQVLSTYADSSPYLLKNPVTGRYQVTIRRRWGERRVCLVESEDLSNWSEPRCIIHPSPNDPPTTHLYDMPQFYYEPGEIFLGFLWNHIMPFDRIMDGPLYTEYVYSYDGLTWNRTGVRMTPERPRGEYGSGTCYVTGMIDRGEDIVFYMNASPGEHDGIPKTWNGGKPDAVIIPGTLPKNRCVCIDSYQGGKAEVMTQHLLLHKPELRLNANVPFGSLKAELLRGSNPIPGYTFEDFQPVSGDFLDKPLCWKGGGLEKFVEEKEWIRLHIAFEQAEIYGIMGDFAFTINTRSQVCDRL